MSCLGPETEILHERYAEALIDISEEADKLDEVADNLSLLNELVRGEELFAKILQDPRISKEDKLKTLEAISKGAHFCDEFRAFLKVLTERDRLNIIHGIFLKYRGLYRERRGRLKVVIETVVSLSGEQISRLKEALSRKFKKDIIIEESIRPGLIGGLNIRIGDLAYNLSLADRLNFMEEGLRTV